MARIGRNRGARVETPQAVDIAPAQETFNHLAPFVPPIPAPLEPTYLPLNTSEPEPEFVEPTYPTEEITTVFDDTPIENQTDVAVTEQPAAPVEGVEENGPERKPTVEEALLEQFPNGTRVKLLASEYKGKVGTVIGIEKRGHTYFVSVEIDVRSGKKVIYPRGASLEIVTDEATESE